MTEPPRPLAEPAQCTAADLAELLDATTHGLLPEQPLGGVSLDSRTVSAGDLYCALAGVNTHGARFAAQAARAGAVLALTDTEGAPLCTEAGLPALVVPDPRPATARAAATVYGHPSRELRMIGVTGTNGKTSVTAMIDQTLLELGRATAVIGTSGTRFRDRHGQDHRIATVRTTPEAPEVQGILARALEAGIEVCSMEVSSHAMVLHRADGIDIDVACFTGLSQDHLDFHHTMEDYFAAKASLFTPEHARGGVVCVDDDWGARLAAEATIPVLTYATDPARTADVVVQQVRADGYGSQLQVRMPDGELRTLRAALPGDAYVANAVAVMLLLEQVGIGGQEVREAIGHAGIVPGRMELVAESPVRAVVDFSHTEDSLARALDTLRALPDPGRLIAVIGAGGDRDTGKRPRMGAAAAARADVVIITDDNPRSEDPAAIREQVAAGIDAASTVNLHVVEGRRQAIELAARIANVGDTILLAGKGAETGQQIGGNLLPFDDRIELGRALSQSAASEARPPAGSPRHGGC